MLFRSNTGNFTTLGTGWSAPSSLYRLSSAPARNKTTVYDGLVYSLYGTPRAACFVAGTYIKMSDGSERKIEEIAIGDLINTSLGSLPVIWIAKRSLFRTAYSSDKYEQGLPVRFEKGSLGSGIPIRDLQVSECQIGRAHV